MTSIAIDRTDGLSSSTAFKGPVRVATTANINLSGIQTIDGVTVAVGDRVLVKDQTTASENGIWVVDTGNWRRAKDFSRTTDVRKGTMLYVTDGTAAGASGWYVSSSNPIVIGTSDVTFVRASILNGAELDGIQAAAEAAQAAAEAAETGAEAARDAALAAVANAFPATRTVLKGYDTSTITNAYLVEAGRQGNFHWDSADLSATIIGSGIASSAVNDSTETITSTAHGLKDGNAVIVTAAVNGLSTNTLYYVIKVDANNFKLATSHANALAGTAVNLTGTSAVTVKQHFDPEEIVYVCPAADITGSAGAWVRQNVDNELYAEWAGATRDNTSADNRRYFDAAVVLATQLNLGGLRFRNGQYQFKTAPNPITVGLHLKGGGHSSSFTHGGTVFMRDFSQSSGEIFLGWDGTGDPNNSTGGGIDGISVWAGEGTTGGRAIRLYATSDTARPGYMEFRNLLVAGYVNGTWTYAFEIDGANCTTSGSQGLRDTHMSNVWLSGATSVTCLFGNATQTTLDGLNIVTGTGSVASLNISGLSAASTAKSQGVNGRVWVAGDLIFNACNACSIVGRATNVTMGADATDSIFTGVVDGTVTVNAASTSKVITPSREYLPAGQTNETTYTRLPGNMILAKGQITLTSSTASYSFGVTFGAVPGVTVTVENASAAYAFKTAVTTTGFNAAANVAGPVTADWVAFGPAP